MICSKCKKDFIVVGNGKKFKTCETCRRKGREAQQRFKRKVKRIYADSNLDQTEAERRAYNEEHGTRYTYGYFVAIRDGYIKRN